MMNSGDTLLITDFFSCRTRTAVDDLQAIVGGAAI